MKNFKKFNALLLALVMVLSLSATALATETGSQGTIAPITEGGVVNGNDITVSGSSLQWFPKDESIGRWTDGWWVGVKITAPTGYAEANSAMYSNNGGTNWKSFNQNKDGEWFITCWLPVQPSYLTSAIGAQSVLRWTYQFDWDTTGANGTYTADQTFTITVNPNDITLKKGEQVYFQTENGVVIVDEQVGSNTESGSITINNAVVDETYNLYKVFDLTFSGAAVSYTYTTTPSEGQSDAFLTALQADASPFTLTASAHDSNMYVVELKEGKTATDVSAFLKANIDELSPVTNARTTGLTNNVANATTISWSGLPYGYYFVDSSLGSLITVNSTLPDVTVQEKNTVPSIKKEVASDLTDDNYQGWGDGDVIDIINYRLTVNTGTNAANLGTGVDENYVIVDTLPTGITYNDNSIAVKVRDTEWTKDTDYTVVWDVTENKLTINLLATGTLKDLPQNTDIIITYKATMDKAAVQIDPAGAATGNTNNVTLTYHAQESKDKAVVYTYQIGGEVDDKPIIQKVDGSNNNAPLAGVKFILSKTEADGTVKYASVSEVETGTNGSYYLTGWTTTEPESGNIITGENGGIIVKGLDAGEYILTEVETLPGYNLLTDTITVTITPAVTTDENGNATENTVSITYKMTHSTDEPGNDIAIENNTGTELPSTGGIGTTIFYVLGGVLVLGAAILIITRRRMSAAK